MSSNALLSGKTIVITGAAGGLGAAICHAAANAGAGVIAGYHRSEQPARALVATLTQEYGREHISLLLPVTDSAALAVAAGTVARRFGHIDALVNCAGMTRFIAHDDLDSLDDALIDEILHTNVRGVIAMVRAFRSLLAASGDGAIVNISSIAAATAMGSNIAYCASKAAVDNLSKSLARALAPTIRVNSVAPGLVDTDFVKALDQSWRDQQCARTPLARLATAADVANAVVAVIGVMKHSTGAVFPVDGGRPLS